MKVFAKIGFGILLMVGAFLPTHAGFLDSIFQDSQPQVHYCNDGECGLQQ